RPWGWDTLFMLEHFGWRAVAAILASTFAYFLIFRRELTALAARGAQPDRFEPEDGDPPQPVVPAWVTAAHLVFMAWTVMTAHYPALFLGGFLIFLGFAKATSVYQSRIEL